MEIYNYYNKLDTESALGPVPVLARFCQKSHTIGKNVNRMTERPPGQEIALAVRRRKTYQKITSVSCLKASRYKTTLTRCQFAISCERAKPKKAMPSGLEEQQHQWLISNHNGESSDGGGVGLVWG